MRAPSIALQRGKGVSRLKVEERAGRTIAREVYQEGTAKLRFPKVRGPLEAVMINLGGGLTDGDELDIAVRSATGAQAVLTTQAAEKIYKSRAAPARVKADIRIARGSVIEWLPQETILFDGANLERDLTFSLADGGCLLAVESVVFGRGASGEIVRSARLQDRLRIKAEERLVWYDAWRLEGDLAAALDRPAIADGCRAMASIYLIGNIDGAALRDRVRPELSALPARSACSWARGVLAFRLLAGDGEALRRSVVLILTRLRTEIYGKSVPLPRVWDC